jgi:hypothetical protein
LSGDPWSVAGVEGVRLLSTTEAGRLLGVSPRTLEDWRLRGGGPLFRKIGRRIVRYLLSDLLAFVRGAARANTGCEAAPG